MARAPCLLVIPILLLLMLSPANAKPINDAFVKEYRSLTDRLLDIHKELEEALWEERTDDARKLLEEMNKVLALQKRLGDRYTAEWMRLLDAAKGRPAIGIGGKAGGRASPPPGGPVGAALAWLARNQHADGYWDCDGHGGYALFDPGVTGLALLTFFSTGQTHRSGAYRDTVKRGLAYLKRVQDPEGCFGPRTTNRFTYNHAVATAAMCQAYALTRSPLFKQSAQRGLDFIAKCQNPYLAWRYGVRPQDNDTSVTGWMVTALAAGKLAGLRVQRECFEGAKNWLDKATETEYGRVGYSSRGTGPARPQDIMERFPPDKSESLTAEGILIRILCGEDPRRSEAIKKGTELIVKVLPRWDTNAGTIDMIYWYYGTHAMARVGGGPWTVWRTAVKTAAVAGQRRDGDLKGSWDHVGVWGREGGRVYATALMAMALDMAERGTFVPGAAIVSSESFKPGKAGDASALDRPVTVSFVRIPLRQVAETLARQSGLQITIPKDRSGTEVNVAVRDLKLRAVLDLVAAFVDLEWRFVGGKIVFDNR